MLVFHVVKDNIDACMFFDILDVSILDDYIVRSVSSLHFTLFPNPGEGGFGYYKTTRGVLAKTT